MSLHPAFRTLEYELVGQFILGRPDAEIPHGWSLREIDGWSFGFHPRLPIIEIRTREGTHIGWLIGYPIMPDGVLLSPGAAFPFALSLRDGAAVFERSLYALGGRFAAIYLAPSASRFYLDPCGSLAAVFCRRNRVVASSPNLIPHSEETREDHELVQAIGIPQTDGWYPFGLTPRLGIERLLPNHYLDLETWETTRHWPNSEALTVEVSPASAVPEIASILEGHVAALTRPSPIYVSLTAGKHTRMILACARNYLSRIRFFTIPSPNVALDLDYAVAQRIAKRFRLSYVSLQWQEPTEADLDEWLYRVGACVAGRASTIDRTMRQLQPDRPVLSGMLGDIGAPKYWRETDLGNRQCSVTDLLEALKMPPVPAIVERAEQWLRGLPGSDVPRVMDFLYLEQRAACWAGPQEYGNSAAAFVLSPLCHRRIVQLMLSLPLAYRVQDRLPRDLIDSRWPQLLTFPINAPTRSMRLLGDPGGTIRSALKHLARMATGAPAGRKAGG